MKYELKCLKCGTPVTFSNWGNIRDVNNKSICSCKDCAEEILAEYKRERLIENYNRTDIYLYEDRYYPYWGCAYSFENIEDCKERIDMKGVAVVPTELLNRVRQGKSLL